MRMHEVMPSSGVSHSSGSVGLSDRDLMRNAIEVSDIKSMLRSTAMPGRVYSGPAAIALPAALVRALGRPGRVPAVKVVQAATKRMVGPNGAIGMDEFPVPLVSDGPRQQSGGRFSIPGTTFTQCEFNAAGNNTYTSHSPAGWNACSWGYDVESLSAAMSAFTNAAGTASFGELNSQVGAQGNPSRRMRFGWSKAAGTKPKLSQRVLARAVSGQMGGNGPSSNVGEPTKPGSSGGAGASGDWSISPADIDREVRRKKKRSPGVTRHMATLPRMRRRPTLRGYEKPGIQYTVVPGGRGEPPINIVKKEAFIHREVPSKEDKVDRKIGRKLLGAYHTATEIGDLFEALADAIPDGRCDNMPGFAKAACVIANWDAIDPVQAAKNILANEIEDRLVGGAQGRLASALKNVRSGGIHGPNTTQLNQWLRNLPKVR